MEEVLMKFVLPVMQFISVIAVAGALRWSPKKNLIINRDLSGGYCKTAVSRWPFSQHK
jgi:hypothetical protein